MKRNALFLLMILFTLVLSACGGTAAVTPEATLVEVTPLPTATDVPPTEEPEPTAVPEPTATALPPTETPPPTEEPVATLLPAAELAEKIDVFMKAQADGNRFTGSVLVARGDEIILSQGYGMADREQEIPNTPTTRFRIGSLTKAFTAMAIMQLQEQDKLNVNDPICNYLADCPSTWQDITIHHLLTHSSGIYNFTDAPEHNLIELTPTPPETAVQSVIDRPLNFEPGTAWGYSNTGYLLLGLIIERVSGQSYEAYLQERVLDPLGMADTGYDHNRDDLATGYTNRFREADYMDMSAPFAAGALYSTVEDLFRWVRAVQSDELVSAETRELIFSQHISGGPGADWGYGYGWAFFPFHDRLAWGHDGAINGFMSNITFVPDVGVASIVLSNQEDINPAIFSEILTKWALGIE